MAGPHSESVLRHLRHLLGPGGTALEDGRLLERFAAHRDAEAFAELVARHGPLVMGVSRRVLQNPQDAEDVFQATFLVLARKAAAIRKPESLSSYLHGIAYRLALKAKTQAAQRRHHEQRAVPMPPTEDADLSWREVRALIDEELARLPEKQRLPLVLCYLEGRTQDEAAQHLGWRRGTLKRRLEKGRERLRVRLSRRGVTLGAGLFAAALTASAGQGAVSATLRSSTVLSAMTFATKQSGAAATRAVVLAEGALRSMLYLKLKLGVMVLLLLSCAAAMAGLALPPRKPLDDKIGTANETQARNDNRHEEDNNPRRDRDGEALPRGAQARLGTLRLRHTDGITPVVFTRDGKTAIAGDFTGNLVFWDLASGKAARRLKLPGLLNGLTMRADGKVLVAGSQNRLYLCDAASGQVLAQPNIENTQTAKLLLTPDGETVILQSNKPNAISLWDVTHEKIRHELEGHTGNIACLALSPDGKTLASGAWNDSHIRLWDVAGGKEKLHFPAFEQVVLHLAYSPDGKTLAGVDSMTGFTFFDAQTGKRLRTVKNCPPGLRSLAYAPDGKTVAGIAGGVVHVFDAADGKQLRTFAATPNAVELTYSPDGRWLATYWSGGVHTFDLWDVASGKRVHAEAGHRCGVTGLAFSADSKTLFSASGSADDGLIAWNAATGEARRTFGETNKGYKSVALSADGKRLAACGEYTLALWNAATLTKERELAEELQGIQRSLDAVAWSADGQTLVSSGYIEKTLRVWDAQNGRQRRVINSRQDYPAGLAVSPDGKMIAVAGYLDGTVRRWETDTGKELPALGVPRRDVNIHAVAFSPDGSLLASGGTLSGGSGDIQLWDTASGQPLRRIENKDGAVFQMVFSRDGRSLVSAHGSGSVRLWEVATGKERAIFTGHQGPVRSVAISRDGRWIASGSDDTTILVWDATGGAATALAPTGEKLPALVDSLFTDDAASAYKAIWRLARVPKQALPLLAENLLPLITTDAPQQQRIARLIADLDSDEYAVREKAVHELTKIGPPTETVLRLALANQPSLESRRRIETLLEKRANDRPAALRALETLEHMNTPEARQLLEKISRGSSLSWLTQEAAAACKRTAQSSPMVPE